MCRGASPEDGMHTADGNRYLFMGCPWDISLEYARRDRDVTNGHVTVYRLAPLECVTGTPRQVIYVRIAI